MVEILSVLNTGEEPLALSESKVSLVGRVPLPLTYRGFLQGGFKVRLTSRTVEVGVRGRDGGREGDVLGIEVPLPLQEWCRTRGDTWVSQLRRVD